MMRLDRWGRNLLLAGFITVGSGITASAQESENGAFRSRDFGRYFVSDYYAPITRMAATWMQTSMEYDVRAKPASSNVYAEPVVGAEIPWFFRRGTRSAISFSMPVSFSIWMDMFEPRTAPVLNADYRVAFLECNYSRQTDMNWPRNWTLKVIPLFHESTHIGDEILLARLRDSILPRVNISYETFEAALLLNDPEASDANNHAVKFTAKLLLNGAKGHYFIDSAETPSQWTDYVSSRKLEGAVAWEARWPESVLSSRSLALVASVDVAARIRFGYPMFASQGGGIVEIANKETYVPTITAMLGWQSKPLAGHAGRLGLFMHGYYGVIRHGQFRNQDPVVTFGLGVTYSP